MGRMAASLPAAVLALLLLAAPALANKNVTGGQGLYGPANDKVVTNTGFILIAAIPLFVALMSYVQWRLDRRKEARKAAAKARRARPEWRGGW